LPKDLIPIEIHPDEEMTVYRVVVTDVRDCDQFVDCFRSHAELGIPPRRNSPEIVNPAIYHGTSMQDRPDRAAASAIAYPRLGDFVAEVRLDEVAGATYWFWGPPGHLTVWGDAVKLAEATVDILSVVRGGSDDLHDFGQLRERARVVQRRGDSPSDSPRNGAGGAGGS